MRAHPGARRDAVEGRLGDGRWKVGVSAAAEGGAANRALERLLAALLGTRAVRIVSGLGSRDKLIEVEGLAPEDVERRLAEATRVPGGRSRRGTPG